MQSPPKSLQLSDQDWNLVLRGASKHTYADGT